MVALSERQAVVGLRRTIRYKACPTLHRMPVRGEFCNVEARSLADVVQIDGVSPAGTTRDGDISAMGINEEYVITVAYREIESFVDGLIMGVGCSDGDRVVADVAVGRDAGDDAGMGIDAQAGRQRGRERQGIARGRRREVTGDVDRERLPLI